MEMDLHSILTSASNFIKSLAEVEAHRKVDLEDKKIKEETCKNLTSCVIDLMTLFLKEVTIYVKHYWSRWILTQGTPPPNNFQTLHSVTKAL